MSIKSKRKKNEWGWNWKKSNSKLSLKKNSNQKIKNQIWQAKKLKNDEVGKKFNFQN
jgi:hypothetical protein